MSFVLVVGVTPTVAAKKTSEMFIYIYILGSGSASLTVRTKKGLGTIHNFLGPFRKYALYPHWTILPLLRSFCWTAAQG